MILPDIIKKAGYEIKFTMMDIGARPTDKFKAPFHKLHRKFNNSKMLAFDADAEMCQRWNDECPAGVRFYPHALGKTEEKRPFFHHIKPEHSSLYEPNRELDRLFYGLEDIRVARTDSLKTMSMDRFISDNNIGPIDFIKTDIQGAELEVFQGGVNTLKNVLVLVSEVEFTPIYKNQPLFEDLSAFLRKKGLLFHKLLNVINRPLKSLLINNDIHIGSQHIYSDAVFVRDITKAGELDDHGLLKTALLLDAYESPDWTHYYLQIFDRRHGTDLADRFSSDLEKELKATASPGELRSDGM